MKKSEKIIGAVLTMVIGILLIAMKDNFIGILMSIAGICLIVLGVIDLINGEVPPAVVKFVVGALVILCGWVLVEAVLYILSAILLIFGILLLYDMLKKKSACDTLLHTVLDYAVPVLCILIGGLLLCHQALALEFIFVASGILALVEGGVLLFNTLTEE
ncbi:MAG: DUF308 domain-containing protein [Clostridia bacterium]|nr:DUF308 domain-containing protein [Clostridia bacterium]